MLNKVIYEPWTDENIIDILDYFQYYYLNIGLGWRTEKKTN